MPPPRHFTHYWANSTWAGYRATATRGELVDYAASNVFRERGVAAGDFLYIVTILQGALFLLTRLEVAEVCSPEEAALLLGEDPDHLWPADDFALAARAAPSDFERMVPFHTAERLRFESGGEPRPLKFRAPGVLDSQTLRGVRELTLASAALLADLLDPLLPLNLSGQRAALAALPPLPEEVNEGAGYREGAVVQITVNAYERNARARQACIAYWGCTCAACGCDFGARYGSVAAGYIHVHHLRPLASLGAEYVLDPVNDIVPVCPNCHAVMHLRSDEPYSVAEVQQFLSSRG